MKKTEIEWTDVRDGMFPSLRYALTQLKKINDENNGKFRNSKRVIEKVVSDIEVKPEDLYDALINLTYPRCEFGLVDGHGNMGFPPADMPFTEMRVSNFYRQIIDEQNKDLNTPIYLPLPLTLINGTSNYKTFIPSHNIEEVIDATIALIKDPTLETRDLLEYIKGPDILVGGEIINRKELYNIYEKGYGTIEIQVNTQTVNEDLWGDISDFCRWYNLKLRKCFLKKEQKILVKYEAKLFDGQIVKYMSLKEILQYYIEYSKSGEDISNDDLCKKLENLKKFSKSRKTKI